MIYRGLIVVLLAIAALIFVGKNARAQGFLDGVRSIEVTMTRDEVCTASQYGVGDGYHGKRTASGAIFNTWAASPFTVAHKTRPFGSWVTITNVANGRSIRAKVTDRGPYKRGRCVDVGRAGANALRMGGLAKVRVE